MTDKTKITLKIKCKNTGEVCPLIYSQLRGGYKCIACGEDDRQADYYNNHESTKEDLTLELEKPKT